MIAIRLIINKYLNITFTLIKLIGYNLKKAKWETSFTIYIYFYLYSFTLHSSKIFIDVGFLTRFILWIVMNYSYIAPLTTEGEDIKIDTLLSRSWVFWGSVLKIRGERVFFVRIITYIRIDKFDSYTSTKLKRTKS